MFLNPALDAALDRIAQRAQDVRNAYTPGAQPRFDDVTAAPAAPGLWLDPLSCALPDAAYAIVRDARGTIAYTRDATFRLADGRLVDDAGYDVMGVRAPGAGLEPLAVDPVDAALGRVQNARLEADGSLTYERASVDPRTGRSDARRVVAGRVALARFPAGTMLDSIDGTRAVPPHGVVAHDGVAGDGTFGSLSPLHRQRSNIDVDRSLERLKAAYIAFDALQAAETAKGRLGKTAMDLLK